MRRLNNGNGLYGKLIEEARNDGIEKYVVGVMVCRNTNNTNEILILQRKSDDFLGGYYELPGGGVDNGETLYDAVERELNEETLLRLIEVTHYFGHFDYTDNRNKPTRQFNFIVNADLSGKIELSEHQSYAWVNEEQLHNYPITDEMKEVIMEGFKHL